MTDMTCNTAVSVSDKTDRQGCGSFSFRHVLCNTAVSVSDKNNRQGLCSFSFRQRAL